MNVLLSINPPYAEAILKGEKKYEFRRTIFKRRGIEKIYLYVNSKVKKIVGSFEIDGVIKGTPEEIWEKCHDSGGISKEDFFKYFEGSEDAYAIKIKNVERFPEPIDPYTNNIFKNFTAPQSFYYLRHDLGEGRSPNLKSFMDNPKQTSPAS